MSTGLLKQVFVLIGWAAPLILTFGAMLPPSAAAGCEPTRSDALGRSTSRMPRSGPVWARDTYWAARSSHHGTVLPLRGRGSSYGWPDRMVNMTTSTVLLSSRATPALINLQATFRPAILVGLPTSTSACRRRAMGRSSPSITRSRARPKLPLI
jgi:hypothetical protein